MWSSVLFDSGIILKSSGGLVFTVNITAGEPATNLRLFLKIMISQRPSSVPQSYQRRCIEVRTSRNSSPTFRISDMVLATKLSVELRSDQDHKMLMSWVLSQICIFMSKHIKLSSLFILIEKPGNETSAPHRLHERCFDHLTLFDLLLLLLLLLLLIVELFPCFIHLILSIAEIPVVYVFSCVFIWYSWFEAVGRGVEGTTETLMITLTLMMMMLKKALGWEKAPSSVFIIVNSWEQFTLCPPRLEIV